MRAITPVTQPREWQWLWHGKGDKGANWAKSPVLTGEFICAHVDWAGILKGDSAETELFCCPPRPTSQQFVREKATLDVVLSSARGADEEPTG